MSEPVIQLRHEFSIVSEKNETIATATIERMHGVLNLTNVWVHYEHRKKGYASAVLRAVIAEFGRETIWLRVYPYTDRPMDEERLANFYREFGFVADGGPGDMKREPS